MVFRCFAGAALGGVLFAATSASADSVVFKTEFDFNPLTSAIDSTIDLGGGASLTLLGDSLIAADADEFNVIFGSVSFDPKDSTGTLSVDQDFLLRVTLIDPGSGSLGETTANFWGSVNSKSTTGSVALTGDSIFLGGFKFTLQDTDVSLLSGAFSSQSLLGNVEFAAVSTAVPVPAAVWGGAGLLGLLGVGKLWRRRIT